MIPVQPRSHTSGLQRGMGTAGALGANVIDMVGVGPFITLPLIVGVMGGPQAMLGWLLGALLSMADGCTWSELGTAHPEAGGSYAYLKHSFSPRWGRAFSFLYAWQLLFSAPLSIASGCIGFAQYASWFLPGATHTVQTLIAIAACVACTALLFQPVRKVSEATKALGIVVLLTLVAVIVIGFTHFSPKLALSFPPGAFHLGHAFFLGLGGGLLISAYDYWGYYNVCFLGAEVRDPARTIPRAVLGSIAIVGTLYLLMNTAVLGVLPWQSLIHEDAGARQYTIAIFTQTAFASHAWSHTAASGAVVLIAVASLASVFALLLGYSRIPYAAAEDGNFPAIFARLHPKHRVPTVALLTLCGVTLVCCLFRLQEVIASLVVVRIVFQFLLQGVAVMMPKHRAERRQRGRFRMPLYPLPTLLAMCGFVYILLSRPRLLVELRPVAFVLLSGLAVYGVREVLSRRAQPVD
ncbi:APC family permease [Terriglobus roseus]|uniref:Amino acid/polyamine/organocation transporter, APC superfamily n=1 Tax=Terriglobus roseus TaxID=392734 RepID=A0A1H4Q1V5_9BACT|nr:APC family permease [Terriglobus roseus]SEC13422.1 amino acid/polyamine/organocation transporter, APC superfamily [Terriglobus roseus]